MNLVEHLEKIDMANEKEKEEERKKKLFDDDNTEDPEEQFIKTYGTQQ